jgi:hypothetical protein
MLTLRDLSRGAMDLRGAKVRIELVVVSGECWESEAN